MDACMAYSGSLTNVFQGYCYDIWMSVERFVSRVCNDIISNCLQNTIRNQRNQGFWSADTHHWHLHTMWDLVQLYCNSVIEGIPQIKAIHSTFQLPKKRRTSLVSDENQIVTAIARSSPLFLTASCR